MRKVLLFILSQILLSPAFMYGQYHTDYTEGQYDITSFIQTGTNAWKDFGGTGSCQAGSLTESSDGNGWCVGFNPSDVWRYDRRARTWADQTAMGTTVKSLAVINDSLIFALRTAAHCPTQGGIPFYGVFLWNSTNHTWSEPNTGACANQMTIGVDKTLTVIGWDTTTSKRSIWYSTDQGVSWTLISDNWSYVYDFNIHSACAVSTTGHVYFLTVTTGSTSQLGNLTDAVGCMNPQGDPVFLSSTSTGVVRMWNDTTATWQAVSGLSAQNLSGPSKGAVFAAQKTTGKLFHLNFYAGYASGTRSGTYTNPPGMNPVPPPTHTVKQRVYFPHSVNGVLQQQSGTYTQAFSVTAWDANPKCDPFVGDPSDPECLVNASGGDTCSSAGPIGSPQLPTNLHDGDSHNLYEPISDPIIDLDFAAGPDRWITQWHVTVVSGCRLGLPTCGLSSANDTRTSGPLTFAILGVDEADNHSIMYDISSSWPYGVVYGYVYDSNTQQTDCLPVGKEIVYNVTPLGWLCD